MDHFVNSDESMMKDDANYHQQSSSSMDEPQKIRSVSLLESVRRKFQSKDIGRQFWMPDSTSINCYDCALKFTTLRRRHHCRICGQIFCNNCCSEMIDSKLLLLEQNSTQNGLLRVCKYCFNKLQNLILEKSKNNDNNSRQSIPIRKASTSISNNRKFSTSSIGDIVRFAKSNMDNNDAVVIDRRDSTPQYGSLPHKNFRPSSAASISCDQRFFLANESDTSSLLSCSFDNVRTMLDELDETITAREPIWVKEMVEEAKLKQGKLTLQEDKENNNNNNIVIVDDTQNTDRNSIKSEFSNDMPDSEKSSIKSSHKRSKFDSLEINKNKASPSKSPFDDNLIDLEKFFRKNFSKKIESKDFNENICTNVPIEIDKAELPKQIVNKIYDFHSEQILHQILKDEKLSFDWLTVLNDIAKEIVDKLKLPQYSYLYSIDNYYQDNAEQSGDKFPYSMDIRKRIKIKSILNGSKTDCSIVNGLVFTKNVAHKKMKKNIDSARILLFACSIGYDERRRSQSNSMSAAFKLTLFDSMRLQESNYIANLVAKIDMLNPDVIFSQGTVSQTALELLHEKDITVVLNVKRSILDRIAFFTNAELIHSPEMILNTTKVGTCKKFHLQEYILSQDVHPMPNGIYCKNRKTLLFLESSQENIGFSVILRGSSRFEDFKKLKNVLRYMIYVHYNNKMEKAFHQSFNCMPIFPVQECNSLTEFYQQICNNSVCNRSRNLSNMINDNEHSVDKMSQLTAIEDFSDPLRSALNAEDDSSDQDQRNKNSNLLEMQLNWQKMEQILNRIPLSCSPYIKFDVPFLMGKNIHKISSLRYYYPVKILISDRLSDEVSVELGRKTIAEESFQQNSSLESKDDDYANYSFLFAQKHNFKESFQMETSKLLFLNLLTSRYMVVKPHPYLINDQFDFKRHSQQFIADFRSCGPYLRYAPDFFKRNNELHRKRIENGRKIESLCSEEHQNITVLFSVFSLQTENAFNYCFKPKLLDIHYYGKNDMSLGSFLLRHFFFRQSRFNQSSAAANQQNIYDSNNGMFSNIANISNNNSGRKIFCPNENCNISMFKHLMRFTHHNGTITVYLNKLNESRRVTIEHKILTWTYCTQCQSISEYKEMSSDSLAISFGKFLELKFYGNCHYNYKKYFADDVDDDDEQLNKEKNDQENSGNKFKNPVECRHSIHKESYQFFSYDQLVVIFKYEPISIYEIVTPGPVIPITRNHFSKSQMIDDLKQLTEQCHEVFSKVKNEIEKIKSFATGQSSSTQLQNMNLESINIAKLDEFLLILQQEEIDFVKKIKEMHYKLSMPELENSNVLNLFHLENNVVFIKKFIAETVFTWNDRIKEFFQDQSRKRNPDNKFISSIVNRFLSNDSSSNESKLIETAKSQETNNNIDKNVENKDDNLFCLNDPSALEAMNPNNQNESTESNANENNKLDGCLNNEKSPNKLSTIKNKMISKVVLAAPKVTSSDNDSSSSSSFTSKIFTRNSEDMVPVVIEMPFDNNNNNNNENDGGPGHVSNASKHQMFEHYQLTTYKDISIIVRDRDPGSIISYSLTTPEYDRKLNMFKSQTKLSNADSMDQQERNNNVNSNSNTNKNESTEFNIKSSSTNNNEDLNQHIDIQFNDVNAKFYCCIYFAELFRKFRSLILVDGNSSARNAIREDVFRTCSFSEDLYIYSLANCIPWNAVGGKSGSTFLKTRDQRFILKEVSKGELKHFLTFVCDYINYCERALMEKYPSAFVKVVGVYQISYKNTLNNKGSIHYILVMENLFYECNVSFIYDLKGSMRNRKIDVQSATYANNKYNYDDSTDMTKMIDNEDVLNSTSNSDRIKTNLASRTHSVSTVLLDENLRQISIAYPLYVHVHSKIFLMEAIHRDSEFLKNHGVMDYSLLVGFDDEHNEYVVGIIDYVRLFNWEKILESRVKKIANAIDPTVVHPSVYQKRFLDAINDYFTQVPDKWYHFLQLVPLAGKFVPDAHCNNNVNNKTTNFDNQKENINSNNSSSSSPANNNNIINKIRNNEFRQIHVNNNQTDLLKGDDYVFM